MGPQLQPSSPQTVYSAAYPQVHTQQPATPQVSTLSHQGPISTTPTQDVSSNFSASDAVNVVCRGLATVTETLYLFGRTVSIYAIKLGALVLGAIKGLLRHCHENESLNNRTVQPVQTLTVQSQAGQNQTGQNQTIGQAADTVVSGKMPLEEYIRVDATEALNSVPESIKILGTIGGMACAFLTPYFFLGPLGLVINIPRIFGVKPYTVFDTLSNESEQMPTLPATSQDSAANQQPESGLYAQSSNPATEALTVGQNHTTQSSQQASLQQTPLTSQQPQESTAPPAQANLIAPHSLSQVPHQPVTAAASIMSQHYQQNPAPQVKPATHQPTVYQSSLNTQPVISTQSTPEGTNPLWNSVNQNVSSLVPYVVS